MADRLTRDVWIAHGFDVLRNKGHEMLKAEPMAKSLGVSRGSFYWHFPSLGDFHAALLAAWRQQNTENIIAELQELPDPRAQLSTLLQRSIHTPQPLENGMRRWGGTNPEVAAALAQVDQLRTDYVTHLLVGLGVAQDAAQDRAILMTWAFIGRAFAPGFVDQTSENGGHTLSQLFVTTP
jgi:AcrR family transcriptional regulator